MAETPTMTVKMATDWSDVIEGLTALNEALEHMSAGLVDTITQLKALSETPDEPEPGT